MTNHVLDRLPEWVGGDLPAPGRAEVQAHLDTCPDCRAAADHLRETGEHLHKILDPPFEADEFTRFHVLVMDQVRREVPPRRIAQIRPRLLLLVSAAAVLLVLALTRPWRPEPQLPVPYPSHSEAALPSNPAVPRLAPLQPATSRMARLRRPPREAAPGLAGPTRIEFQTSDPTVRIIWLAQATPPPDSNPTLPENP